MSIASAGNVPVADTGSWHPDPTFRGTWGIISTCLSTLIISVWSAIHMDIPRQRSPYAKLYWLIAGLFAPDWLLLRAFAQLHGSLRVSQWAKAHLIAEKTAAPPRWWESLRGVVRHYAWRKTSARSSDTPEDEQDVPETVILNDTEAGAAGNATELSVRKNAWTLYHSFYVFMGGFALDCSSTSVAGTGSYLPLTLPMLELISKHAPEIIPDLPRDRIQGWSKSNWVAKALLVMQLLYFTASCVARLAQGLPLSLLEVWTVAHALGAIMAYAMWWEKPLDISEPTIITGETAREFAAFLQMVGTPSNIYASTVVAEVDVLEIIPSSEHSEAKFHDGLVQLPHKAIGIEGYTFSITSTVPASKPDGIFDGNDRPWWVKERGPESSVELTQADILRWQLAARAATRMGGGAQFQCRPDIRYYATAVHWFIALERSIAIQRLATSALTDMALCGMMIAYELPHLLGWRSLFPSHLERVLWRIASIIVAVTPAIFSCGSNRPSKLQNSWSIVLGLTITSAAYIAAHVYLLVESFRQLSHLPDGAFLLPNLSVYAPHFA